MAYSRDRELKKNYPSGCIGRPRALSPRALGGLFASLRRDGAFQPGPAPVRNEHPKLPGDQHGDLELRDGAARPR